MEKRWEWRSRPLPRRVFVTTGKPDVDDLHETILNLVGAEKAQAFLAAAAAAPATTGPPPSTKRTKLEAARRLVTSPILSSSGSSVSGGTSPIAAAPAAGPIVAAPVAVGSSSEKRSFKSMLRVATTASNPSALAAASLAHLGPAESSVTRRATAQLRFFGDQYLRAPPPPPQQQARRLGAASKLQLFPQASYEGDDDGDNDEDDKEDHDDHHAGGPEHQEAAAEEAAAAVGVAEERSPAAAQLEPLSAQAASDKGASGKSDSSSKISGGSGTAKTPLHKRNSHKPLLEPSKSPPRMALYELRRQGLHLAIEGARSPAFSSAASDDDGFGGGNDDGSVGWPEDVPSRRRERRRFDYRQSPRRLGAAGAGRRVDGDGEPQGLLTPGQLKQAVDEAFKYLMSAEVAEGGGPQASSAAAEGEDEEEEEEEEEEDEEDEEDEDEEGEHAAPSNAATPDAEASSSSSSSSSPPLMPVMEDAPPQQKQRYGGVAAGATAAGAAIAPSSRRRMSVKPSVGGIAGSLSVLSGVKLRTRMAMAEAKEADAKLRCAQSLCEWAAHEGNVERLFTEGAVDAVIRLSKEPQPLVRRYCARAFRRMSARPLLAKEMLAVGGIVSRLSRMLHPETATSTGGQGQGQQRQTASTPRRAAAGAVGQLQEQQEQEQQQQEQQEQPPPPVPQQIVVDCLTALLNLTMVPESEAQLVEEGIVPTFMSLIKDREDYDELAARGLYNLARVEAPYPYIDRVVKALVSLAASGVPSVRQLCALALCSLAALKPMRLRLVEEGVVQATAMLIRGGDPTTRRACAVVLQSLTVSKPVRTELVSRGAIPLLRQLSGDREKVTLRCVALALLRLAGEDAGLVRLASEGGVRALSAVALKSAAMHKARAVRACAQALHAVSRKPELHDVLISHRQQQQQADGEGQELVLSDEMYAEEEGPLPALMSMLRVSSATLDYTTVHFALLALCNLLALDDNHGPILRAGGIPALVQLCRHADLQHLELRAPCAYAIFTLTRTHREARQEAVAAGAIPVLVGLVNDDAGSEETERHRAEPQHRHLRTFCAATLALLATDAGDLQTMLQEGVLATFVRLLEGRSETTTVRFCCAALCRFARDADACLRVLDAGAVPHLIANATEGEREAGQACCTVLAALSAQPDSRRRLCLQHPDVLPALLTLAAMDDEATKLRCAATLANLSCESLTRNLMVQHGVVRVLADLSMSYSEEAQAHCAMALCNLACLDGEEAAVVSQGGLGALMMIGMVRAVSLPTKRLCAQAMLNLLTPQTLGPATEEGLVPACATLSKLEDEASMEACALIFARLSTDERARRPMVEKAGTLHALIHLMRARSLTTQLIVGRAVCNLLIAPDSRPTALREGGLAVVRQVVQLLEDKDAGEEEEGEGKDDGGADDAAARDELEGHIIKTLSLLCQLPEHRPQLLAADTVPVMLTLLVRAANAAEHKPRHDLCVRVLALLLWHSEARAQFVREGGVPVLMRVMRPDDTDTAETHVEGHRAVVEMCIRSFVSLALEPKLQPALLNAPVLPTLRHLHLAQLLNPASYELTALLLRLLTAPPPSSSSASLTQPLLQAGTLPLLTAVVAALPHRNDALLHCTVALYHLVLEREALEAHAATEEQQQPPPAQGEEVTALLEALLVALGVVPVCRPLVSSVLGLLSVGLSRYGLLVHMEGVLPLLHSFLLLAQAEQQEKEATTLIVQNACAAVLALSKASPISRLQLQQAGFLPHLLYLSKTPDIPNAIVQLAVNALRRLSSAYTAPNKDAGGGNRSISSVSGSKRGGGGGGGGGGGSNGQADKGDDGVKEGAVAALIATALDTPMEVEGGEEEPPLLPTIKPVDVAAYMPQEQQQEQQQQRQQQQEKEKEGEVLEAPSAPKIPARAGAVLPEPPELPSLSLKGSSTTLDVIPAIAAPPGAPSFGVPTALATVDSALSSAMGTPQLEGEGEEGDKSDEERKEDDMRAAFAGKLGLPAGVPLLEEPDILLDVEHERQQSKANQQAAASAAGEQRKAGMGGAAPPRRAGLATAAGSSAASNRLRSMRNPRATILFRHDSTGSDEQWPASSPPSPYAEVLQHKSPTSAIFSSTGSPRQPGRTKRRMKAAALLVRSSLLAFGKGGQGQGQQPNEGQGEAAAGMDAVEDAQEEEDEESEEGNEGADGTKPAEAQQGAPSTAQQREQQQSQKQLLQTSPKEAGNDTAAPPSGSRTSQGSQQQQQQQQQQQRPSVTAAPGSASATRATAVRKPKAVAVLDEDALLQLQPPPPIDHGGKTRLPDPFDESLPTVVGTFSMRYPHEFGGSGSTQAPSRKGKGTGHGARRAAPAGAR